MKRNVARSVWALFVTLSMMSTAAAACLCGHSQAAKTPAEMCHTERHGTEGVSDAPAIPAPDGDHAQAECDCFAYISVPGAAAANFEKRTSDLPVGTASGRFGGDLSPRYSSLILPVTTAETDKFVPAIPRVSAPSRAPPRI